VDRNYPTHNVATESQNPNSVLNWYRGLIKLRRSNPAFYSGSYASLNDRDQNIMAYLRKSSTAEAVVILNFSAEPQTVALDSSKLGAGTASVLLSTDRSSQRVNLNRIELGPYGVVIAEVAARNKPAH
jgi:alpha-glucosidase